MAVSSVYVSAEVSEAGMMGSTNPLDLSVLSWTTFSSVTSSPVVVVSPVGIPSSFSSVLVSAVDLS